MGKSKMVLSVVGSILSISIMVLLVIVVLKVGKTAYDMGYRIFTEPAMDKPPGQDMTVQIEEGMSSIELGNTLEEKKLVDSGLLFTIQLLVLDYDDKLKPGTYTLNTSQTAKEMMQVMAEEEIEETEETEE